MKKGRVILENERFQLTLKRLCHQLIENYEGFENTCIVAIQERGVLLANRIVGDLKTLIAHDKIDYGKLDITFYRDDFRRREILSKASTTEMDFIVEGKRVILIDDVLYTGRTIQAALTALQHYGRPKTIELLCLVDRRFNRHLPIHSDYTGITVDALDEAYVKVEWQDGKQKDRIILFSPDKIKE
jgi:pyrimidine operon attenuation protein/uracil phosphoribosyltransferase